MTLSEIETILEELAARHQNLNNELLTTLLQSAGWEEKNIKDALMLFKQGVKKNTNDKQGGVPVAPVDLPNSNVSDSKNTGNGQPAEITFYDTDGAEEKELHEIVVAPIVREANKEESLVSKVADALPEVAAVIPVDEQHAKEDMKIDDKVPDPSSQRVKDSRQPVVEEIKDIEPLSGSRDNNQQTVASPSVLSALVNAVSFIETTPPLVQQEVAETNTIKHEPQSLIPQQPVIQKVTKKQSEIPDDLPLLPFESSEQVWPFSKYKDVFHGEVMPEVTTDKQGTLKKEIAPVVVSPSKLEPEVEVEIDLEKTPMTKGDESLVFLAGLMLFVIILILGYMYSNGRL